MGVLGKVRDMSRVLQWHGVTAGLQRLGATKVTQSADQKVNDPTQNDNHVSTEKQESSPPPSHKYNNHPSTVDVCV